MKSDSLQAKPTSFPGDISLEYHVHFCFKFCFYGETQVPKWLFVEY